MNAWEGLTGYLSDTWMFPWKKFPPCPLLAAICSKTCPWLAISLQWSSWAPNLSPRSMAELIFVSLNDSGTSGEFLILEDSDENGDDPIPVEEIPVHCILWKKNTLKNKCFKIYLYKWNDYRNHWNIVKPVLCDLPREQWNMIT